MAFVIAIAGTSGAGKTSITRRVTELLGDAVSLYFDDYAGSLVCPTDLRQWVARGADPAEWINPDLAHDLRLLRDGHEVARPGRELLAPARYVVLEEPFGRARPSVTPLVDFAVFLALPLEVALARRLLRQLSAPSCRSDPPACLESMDSFLRQYLNDGLRDAYAAANDHASRGADLIVDATRPLDELAEAIAAQIRSLEAWKQ
jgi:uridine kinase